MTVGERASGSDEPARFAAELRALRMACGNPSYAALRRGSALLPPATVSDSLNGRVIPRLEFVLAFVQGCVQYASQRGIVVEPGAEDTARWQRRWVVMRQLADAGRRGVSMSREAGDRRQSPGDRTVAGEPAPDVEASMAEYRPPGPEAAEATAAVRRTAPWQLPTPVRELFGREADIAWLDAIALQSDEIRGGSAVVVPSAVEPPTPPVVVIQGMGGVGKTALAVWWGHRHRAQFPDGQLFADLNGFGPGERVDPARVLDLFVRALGAPPQEIPTDLAGLTALFRTLCADRRLLVLLDNAADGGQVLPLLPASPAATVVVTGRGPLPALAVHADALRRTMRPLADADAVALLGRDLGDADPDRLRRLAAVCGNLPLALRLAASRLHDDPRDAGLAAAMDAAGSGAGSSGPLLAALTDPAHPRLDLSAVLAWSVSASTTAESRALLLMSAAPGTAVDDHLAAALVGLPVSPTRTLLSALAARHLLERSGRELWRMHDLVRAWARDEAMRSLGARQIREAQRRALGYYLWTADAMDRVLLPQRGRPSLTTSLPRPLSELRIGDAAAASRWGGTALASIVRAADVAVQIGEFGCAAQLPHIMMSYLNRWKPWGYWIDLCRIGLQAAAHEADPELASNLHIAAGIAYRETHALSHAIDEFVAARDGFHRSGNVTGAAMASNNLANVFRQTGELSRARDELVAALRALEARSDHYRRAIVLHNLAEVQLDLGALDDALGHARRALAAETAARDDLGAAMTRTTMAQVQMKLGRFDIAEEQFTAALAAQRAAGARLAQATTQRRLGALMLEVGRPQEAVTHLAESLSIMEELGDPDAQQVSPLLDRARAAVPGANAVPMQRGTGRRGGQPGPALSR